MAVQGKPGDIASWKFAALLLLFVTPVRAQEAPPSTPSDASPRTRHVSPWVPRDTSFFPEPTVIAPTWPGVPTPVPQAESDEPGSFKLGAIVGGVVAYILLSQDADGGSAVFPFVPICALIGGVLFWTIGIG